MEPRERQRLLSGDYALYLGSLYFLISFHGPSAATALFTLFVHFTVLGRRRISLLPLYLTLIGSGVYILSSLPPSGAHLPPPLPRSWLTHALLRAPLLLGVLGFMVLESVVFPLLHVATPIPTTGPCKDVAQVFVPLQDFGVSCTVRVFYPAKLSPTSPPTRLPYWINGHAVAAGISHSYRSIFMPTALFAWNRWLPGWTVEGDPLASPLDGPAAVAAATAAGFLKPWKGAAGDAPTTTTTTTGSLPRLPVVLFSSGLSGTPDMYSNVIAELVSHGCVVLAPEHADGSSAFATLPEAKDPGGGMTFECLTAEELADRAKKYARRAGQLKHRARELAACAAFASALGALGGARGGSVARKGRGSGDGEGRGEGEGQEEDEEEEEEEEDEEEEEEEENSLNPIIKSYPLPAALLGGCLEVGRIAAVVGHSFGGASVLSMAESTTLPTGLRHFSGAVDCVVCLDTWAFPLSPHTLSRGVGGVPLLTILGEGFARWRENIHALRLLCEVEYRREHPSTRQRVGELGGRSANNGFLEDGSMVEGMGAEEDGMGWGEEEEGAVDDQKEGGLSRRGGGGGGRKSSGESGKRGGGGGASALPPLHPTLGSPTGGTTIPPPPGPKVPPRVHPSTALVALRDVYHQSFSDFATVGPWLLKVMKLKGRSRSGRGEAELIRALMVDYIRFIRLGGAGEAYTPPSSLLPQVLPTTEYGTSEKDQ